MASKFPEESVAVRDLIQKSQSISSPAEGHPERYLLLTTRSNLEKDGSVRKWTFGQRKINMQSKILLLVGETGTGKTTLINAMVNYLLGVKFTDEVWFEITEEGGDKQMADQSETQSTKITVYEVFAQDNAVCLCIIDTPGYGDTRGKDKDKQIAENLYKLFDNDTGVKEIDAVCLVVKASDNQLSDRRRYIFNAVLSLFGKDIENNTVIFVTHSDGMAPEDAPNAIKEAGIPCRKDEGNEPEHFVFNNRQAEKRSQEYNKPLQTAWEKTEDSLNKFFASLKEENRKSLVLESKRLEACISNLQHRIEAVEHKSKELTQIQKALEENREKIQRNENFSITITKFNKEYSESNKMQQEKKKGKKHDRHSREIIVTFEEIKKQFGSSDYSEKLNEDLTKTKKEKAELVEESCNTIMELSKTDLKSDSDFIVHSLDFLIPRAEETGRDVLAEKLKELREVQLQSQKRVNPVTGYARAGFKKLKNVISGKK